MFVLFLTCFKLQFEVEDLELVLLRLDQEPVLPLKWIVREYSALFAVAAVAEVV